MIGVGGSGRQSLSRLAVFIMGQNFVEPHLTKNYTYEAWSEDIKEMFGTTGCDHKTTSFFLSDACLKFDFMLEDVNSFLNSGEIPNLYSQDEKIMLIDRISGSKKGDVP